LKGTSVGGGDIADWISRIEKPDFRAAFDKAFFASVARRVGFGIHADQVRLREAQRLRSEVEAAARQLLERSLVTEAVSLLEAIVKLYPRSAEAH
jgi:hypothetical protein